MTLHYARLIPLAPPSERDPVTPSNCDYAAVSVTGNEDRASVNNAGAQLLPTFAMRTTPQKEYPSTACLRQVVIEPAYPARAALYVVIAMGSAWMAVQQ
jgi:hypothetical protein